MSPLRTVLLGLLLSACGSSSAPTEAEHAEGSERGEHGAEEVVLTPAALEAARLRIQPAEQASFAASLHVPGRIQLDPAREARVSARMQGTIEAIRVAAGDRVQKGQVLATVQAHDLGEALAAWHKARARVASASARKERLTTLEEEGVASRAQVLDAQSELSQAMGDMEAAEERLKVLGVPEPDDVNLGKGEHFPSEFPITSPIAGEVLAASVSVGQSVAPGDALFHVGDLDRVWLLLDLSERDLSRVAPGQPVTFTVDAWPQATFSGTVDKVGSWIEPDARTLEVRVVVDNPDHRLKPNMYANAQLGQAPDADAPIGIVVPADAVQELEGRQVVFVAEGEGRFEARPVAIAERNAEQVLLASGVQAGEAIVVEGAFTLKSELVKGELGEGHAH